MTFVPRSEILPRFLRRPAMLFLAVAQMLLAFAPIAEGKLGASASAHAESADTGLHHAHDDANCSACVARQLLSSSELPPRQLLSLDGMLPQAAPAFVSLPASPALRNSRPRAPPAFSV